MRRQDGLPRLHRPHVSFLISSGPVSLAWVEMHRKDALRFIIHDALQTVRQCWICYVRKRKTQLSVEFRHIYTFNFNECRAGSAWIDHCGIVLSSWNIASDLFSRDSNQRDEIQKFNEKFNFEKKASRGVFSETILLTNNATRF